MKRRLSCDSRRLLDVFELEFIADPIVGEGH